MTTTSSPPAGTPSAARRRVLVTLAKAVGATLTAAIAAPVALFLGHPLRRSSVRFATGLTRVGPVEHFELGKPMKVAVTAPRQDAWLTTPAVTVGSVWVIRTAEKPPAFTVLSTTCPHLGCSVNATGEAETPFRCPCHNARFGLDGTKVVLGGTNPAPRPMDALEHAVKDDALWVRYERFKTGTAERIPVGSGAA